jgi:glycosyltransferase involved in cell wall biosynthesis
MRSDACRHGLALLSSVRIAFVILGELSLTSGGFIYDRMLIERLRARGHEVDVVSLPWSSYAGQLAANFTQIPWPRPLREYELVLQDELAHPALTVRNLYLRCLSIPVVALVHNLTFRQPRVGVPALKQRVEEAYLRGVDAAICVCEDTRRDVARSLRRHALSSVAYAGRDHLGWHSDHAQAVSRAHEGGPLRVAMLCHVSAHKGLHRLLAAIRHHAAQQIELHVIGSLADLPYVHAQRRFVGAHQLAQRVHFHGELHGDALWAQLMSAQVLALPSDREAFPLSAIEALGAGVPVLATAQGGAGELIRDRIEGRLLEPDDGPAWSLALSELAGDRALLAQMSSAALSRYHALGTWAQTAEAVEALLLQIHARRTNS